MTLRCRSWSTRHFLSVVPRTPANELRCGGQSQRLRRRSRQGLHLRVAVLQTAAFLLGYETACSSTRTRTWKTALTVQRDSISPCWNETFRADGRIRTDDLLITNQLLLPTELRQRVVPRQRFELRSTPSEGAVLPLDERGIWSRRHGSNVQSLGSKPSGFPVVLLRVRKAGTLYH